MGTLLLLEDAVDDRGLVAGYQAQRPPIGDLQPEVRIEVAEILVLGIGGGVAVGVGRGNGKGLRPRLQDEAGRVFNAITAWVPDLLAVSANHAVPDVAGDGPAEHPLAGPGGERPLDVLDHEGWLALVDRIEQRRAVDVRLAAALIRLHPWGQGDLGRAGDVVRRDVGQIEGKGR